MISRILRGKVPAGAKGWIYDKRAEAWATYQIDLRINGERIRRRGFRTKKEAEEFVADLKSSDRLAEFGLSKTKIQYPLLSDLFGRRLEELDSTSVSSQERARAARVFPVFLEIVGPGARVSDVQKNHYREFAESRVREGVKPATANREITAIAATMNRVGDFFPDLEGFRSPPVFRPKFSKKGRSRIIAADEREKLLEALTGPGASIPALRAGLILQFALLTGLRHGEIAILKKSWLDLRRGVIRVERPKTDSSGEIRLSSLALEVLDRADRELYPTGEFFFSDNGKPHAGIYRLIKAECDRLGLPWGRKTADGFVLHDARHTFITALAGEGFDFSTISSFSGHSKQSMAAHYTHATDETRSRASEYIAKVIGGNKSKDSDLRELFDGVRSGEIDFDRFVDQVKKLSTF